jgi:hypothetical protein
MAFSVFLLSRVRKKKKVQPFTMGQLTTSKEKLLPSDKINNIFQDGDNE